MRLQLCVDCVLAIFGHFLGHFDGDSTGYSPPAYVDCALADGLFPDPHNCRGSVFKLVF